MSDELAPSAGASETQPGSAPSPSAPAPVQESQPSSLDQIWEGLDTSSAEDQITTEEAPAEEAVEPVEGEPPEAEEAVEAKPEEEEGKEVKEPTEEEKEAGEPVVAPVEAPYIKKAMEALKGDPQLAQSIKNLYYRDAGFREQFQTPKEARAYRELVPDLDEAKALVQSREQLQNFDYGFANDPIGLVAGLHRNSPRETRNLLAALPSALAGLTDEQGQPDLTPFKTLSSTMFRTVLTNLRGKAAENPDLMEAIEMVEAAAGVKPGGDKDEQAILQNPKVQAVMRENEEHRKQQENNYREAVNNFGASADEKFRDRLEKEIRTWPLFKDAAYTNGAKEAILGELTAYAEEQMAAWLKAELPKLMKGDLDATHQENVVNEMLRKGRAALRSNGAKAILTHWTQDILASNRREISRREAIGSRRDVGSGGHAGAGLGGRSTANKPFDQMTPGEKDAFLKQYPSRDALWSKLEGGAPGK